METLQAQQQLPKYKSHKTVSALKIAAITRQDDGSLLIEPTDKTYEPFIVHQQFVPKHRDGVPEVGWYWVKYENDYESFSPADAFEKGYTPDLGATGQFPEGKLTEHDEGELRFAVGRKDGDVFIEFGKPVKWLAMPPQLAKQLAGLLLDHAAKLSAN